MTSNPLVGVWRLLSWENRSADGTIDCPLGREAVGLIIYTDDGYMSVAIARAERMSFAAGDLLEGSREEKAGAAGSYVSYCGRYDFRGDSVVHHVELSLFPNWSGADQERLVEVTGNRLTLRTIPLLLGGTERSARLVWERV
ncbi:MAG: lipocalin-like domain-containing protein [Actinomycetota bacterium]|nr:lipocalin-like domain-containing protein [Actinomycetota bacterium]